MTVTERRASDRAAEDALLAGLADRVTLADDVRETRETLPVEAPFTGEVLGEVPACTEADVAAAVERAREAQADWAARPVAERAEVVRTFHDLVLDHEAELLDVVQFEGGKSRRAAHEELQDVVINCRHYAHRAADYLAPERRRGGIPLVMNVREYHHPVGVVGIIAPWNYPLSLAVSDAIPALLAGNAVVLKPAEQTPYTALRAAQLLDEAGLPADLFAVVPGHGNEVGPALIDRVDFVGFTGSTSTGRKVAAQAGENLVDCSLELGGKNPAVVLPDADLDRAVAGLVRGSFTNAGQLCLAIERIYVHEDVRDEFTERFVAAVEDLDVGTGLDYGFDVGSLVSADHLAKVEGHVADARERGATVLAGGAARPDVGPYFYEPTVLTGVTDDMAVACDETFGPVVGIYGVGSVEEAVARANDSEYGLNASVWTGDEDRGFDVARRIECGTVNVNEVYATAHASVDAPMGGMKDSGVGRRHGDGGILKYTESQTVASQRFLLATAPPGVPYPVYAKVMNRAMWLAEKVPGLR